MREPRIYRSRSGTDDYLSRWKRIVHLDQCLREGGHRNAVSLARDCGVSPKTIYRDLQGMKEEMGAPIEFDPVRGGYRYSEPGFAIPASHLSERELFALMVAESAISQYVGTPLAGALRAAFDKILAFLPGEVRAVHAATASAIHFGGLPPIQIHPLVWSDLCNAIHACERVELQYFLPRAGQPVATVLDPHVLVVRDREWFLVARTLRHANFALYYLPRIRSARKTGERFSRSIDFDPERYFAAGFNAMHGNDTPAWITLRFPKEHAHLADERAWNPAQQSIHHRDGSVSVRFRSGALFEVARQVLRYGGRVEVVSPAALRRDVRVACAKMIQLHGGRGRAWSLGTSGATRAKRAARQPVQVKGRPRHDRLSPLV